MNKNESDPYKSWLINGLFCLLYRELSSTNLTGITLMNENKIGGATAIITDSQVKGRGQLRTKWHASPHKNLTYSLVLPKINILPQEQFKLNKAICLSVQEALSLYSDDIQIKWPNDLYYRNQKLGGLLIENQIQGSTIKSCVIGIGLNINETEWPDDLQNPISLNEIIGKQLDVKKLQQEMTLQIFQNFQKYLAWSDAKINEAYHSNLLGLNEWREFKDNEGVFSGKILGTDTNGLLRIENKKGTVQHYPLKSISFLF